MKQKDNFEHSATSVCPPIRRQDVGVIADKVDEAVT